MSAKAQRQKRRRREGVAVSSATLQMLGVALQAAFRMHCTGEIVGGKNAWQLVHDVQRKLADLSHCQASPVSEERLQDFVARELALPRPTLAQVA
jgi:hypothetical protein